MRDLNLAGQFGSAKGAYDVRIGHAMLLPGEGRLEWHTHIAARIFPEWKAATLHSRLKQSRNCGSTLRCMPAKHTKKTPQSGLPRIGRESKALSALFDRPCRRIAGQVVDRHDRFGAFAI